MEEVAHFRTVTALTEEWNGTSWTETTDLSYSKSEMVQKVLGVQIIQMH
jgi:hypothetical protein